MPKQEDNAVVSETQAITRMQSLLAQWEGESHQRAIFLSCYRMMTSNVLEAIAQEEFQDSAWVREFLHRFADYYFVALEDYERDPASAPRVWQLAHSTAHDRRSLPIENLLLGVNAHINYDLVLTLVDQLSPEWSALSDEARATRYADHCYINKVLARTIDSVQEQVLEPAMPGMGLIDKLLGPLDELLISRVITQWRETVWQYATRLLEAESDEEQAAVLRQVEEETLRLGNLIRLKDQG
jgi:hypothetical protein